MRVLLDGNYFGEGEDLSVFAELTGLSVERFSFHLDDYKAYRRAYIRRRAAQETEAVAPVYELLYLLSTNAKSDARIKSLGDIAKKAADLERQIEKAKTNEEVEAVIWT